MLDIFKDSPTAMSYVSQLVDAGKTAAIHETSIDYSDTELVLNSPDAVTDAIICTHMYFAG